MVGPVPMGSQGPPFAPCRTKGFAKAGSYKASTLAKLAYSPGISSINFSTHKVCSSDECSFLIAVECLSSSSSTKCTRDSTGNYGNNNTGKNNYGNGNKGNGNIGALVGLLLCAGLPRVHGGPGERETPWEQAGEETGNGMSTSHACRHQTQVLTTPATTTGEPRTSAAEFTATI